MYRKDNFCLKYTKNNNSKIEGIVVSMWNNIPKLRSIFDIDFCQQILNRVRQGYGSRYSALSGGVNLYLGERNSSRPLPKPNLGYGSTECVDYSRKSYPWPEHGYAIWKKVKYAATETLSCVHKMNYNYMQFIEWNTCSQLIWTQGTSAKYIKNFNKSDGTISYKTSMAGMKHCIGYYVKPHIDKADKLNSNVYKDWWYCGNHQTFNEQTLEYKN